MNDTLQKNQLTTTATTGRTAAIRSAETADVNAITLSVALGAVAIAVIALMVIGVLTANTLLLAGGGVLMVAASMVGVYAGVNIAAARTA